MASERLSQQLIDKAVKTALDHNTKSSIMLLLRERLIREVVEVVSPIIIEPFAHRIAQLEAEVEALRGATPQLREPPVVHPPVPQPKPNERLDKLKDALDDVLEAIEVDDKRT